MKNFLFALLAFIALGCSSGGGGGSSPTGPSGSAPGISNLQYSPHSATVGQGGGAVTATGTIDFIDADGDVSSFKITGNGTEKTYPVAGATGIKSGTIYITAVSDTTTARSGTFQVSVIDSQGHESNKLTGTFTVN